MAVSFSPSLDTLGEKPSLGCSFDTDRALAWSAASRRFNPSTSRTGTVVGALCGASTWEVKARGRESQSCPPRHGDFKANLG